MSVLLIRFLNGASMNQKFVIFYLLTGFAVSAIAAPPVAPNMYAAGPASMQFSNVDLFASEKAAYALLEGAMQVAGAVIKQKSCSLSAGTYDLNLFSDGSINNTSGNWIVVDSPASTFTLYADIDPNDDFWGQGMVIEQTVPGALKRVALQKYSADVTFNAEGTLMTMYGSLLVKGINGAFVSLESSEVKSFYAATDSNTGLPYIFDWGLQSLSIVSFPTDQYWERLQALRDDGTPGRTVFVKDRLVGPTSCRIVINTSDYNNADYFFQTGTLTISTSAPGVPIKF